jgi:hypothetical protein
MAFDPGLAGTTLADMKWSEREYTFVATHTATVLQFASTSDGSCGAALDNIRISETLPPPPASTPATTADCKDGGWDKLVDADGNAFRNQGDCVSYVASDGRNVAALTGTSAAHPRSAANPAASHDADQVRLGASMGDTAERGKSSLRPETRPHPRPTTAAVPSGNGPSR